MITSLPQLINLIIEGVRLYRDDLYQYFIPFLCKNYSLRNINGCRELYNNNKLDLGSAKHSLNDKKYLKI